MTDLSLPNDSALHLAEGVFVSLDQKTGDVLLERPEHGTIRIKSPAPSVEALRVIDCARAVVKEGHDGGFSSNGPAYRDLKIALRAWDRDIPSSANE